MPLSKLCRTGRQSQPVQLHGGGQRILEAINHIQDQSLQCDGMFAESFDLSVDKLFVIDLYYPLSYNTIYLLDIDQDSRDRVDISAHAHVQDIAVAADALTCLYRFIHIGAIGSG